MLALTFQVGGDRVAVDVRRIREVVPRVRLSPASDAPEWVAGVFVYRGRVVPVIDLHRLTGAGECPNHLSSRILLLPWSANEPQKLVGLLATQVAENREIHPENAQELPGGSDGPGLGLSLPDGDSVLRILDVDRLLAGVVASTRALTAVGVKE